jgi:3-hydroxymyristoyl/3-hydroxydecanoyl-(acyl carrier protein) dehydratase
MSTGASDEIPHGRQNHAFEARKFIRGRKTVSLEEYFLRERLGMAPALDPSLLLESLLQLGNWLIVLSSDFTQMGMILRTGRIEFLCAAGPGQAIETEVNVRSYREDGICFDGQATVDGQCIAHGTGCLGIPVPLEEYHDPGNLRVLFQEIHQPRED